MLHTHHQQEASTTSGAAQPCLPSSERVFSIFRQLNQIPRPSHHEERMADFLCQFADRLHLEHERDAENCVVIRKPASPGYEQAEPVVLLNHMDMVCVGMSDPLRTPIETYVKDGWMMARGTSLGADNGIGLSMALAVLEDDRIPHPALEVITTTNEEDGMSGAAALSEEFIRGRKVINLDSEDYDTITTGAAGACLQIHRIAILPQPLPADSSLLWHSIRFEGGLGGHSGVDIDKERCSVVIPAQKLMKALYQHPHTLVAHIHIGEANASIASSGQITVGIPHHEAAHLTQHVAQLNQWLQDTYAHTDPHIVCTIQPCEAPSSFIPTPAVNALLDALQNIPQGVVKMSQDLPHTVETSNNIGRIDTAEDHLLVTTHTRSFLDTHMHALSQSIAHTLAAAGASTQVVMTAPAWKEDQHSPFLQLVSDAFLDTLGWRPRMVAMHFVLEAGFFVQHYPGIQIACIGPRIVQPHSTSERVEVRTIDDIWQVLLTLLARLK